MEDGQMEDGQMDWSAFGGGGLTQILGRNVFPHPTPYT